MKFKPYRATAGVFAYVIYLGCCFKILILRADIFCKLPRDFDAQMKALRLKTSHALKFDLI